MRIPTIDEIEEADKSFISHSLDTISESAKLLKNTLKLGNTEIKQLVTVSEAELEVKQSDDYKQEVKDRILNELKLRNKSLNKYLGDKKEAIAL